MSASNIIRKIHIYAGLFFFTQLMIYGFAGLSATTHASLERPKIPRSARYVPFEASGSMTDKQIADEVYRKLAFPMSRPMPDWYLRRTPDNHLLLDFHNINGIYRVVVLENEKRLRVENIRNSMSYFLGDMHTVNLGELKAPPLMLAWAAWNQLAMWALFLFCVSGVYLWLSSRPRLYWAYGCVAAGTLSLALLWAAFR